MFYEKVFSPERLQMIDQASSQPALYISQQIQKTNANFPPLHQIISPVYSAVMCYHLPQHFRTQVRPIHNTNPTFLTLLALCCQPDNGYRCISSRSPEWDHDGHLRRRSSSQEYKHPMNKKNCWSMTHEQKKRGEISHLYCLPCASTLMRRHSMSIDGS